MRSIHFIAVIGLILFCAYPHVFYGQEGGPFQLCERSVFCPAESLVYEVSWLGIKLGQVRLITGFPTIDSGRVTYHAAAFIDSYSGLPFVDLHAFDYSNFDSSFHSLGFRSSDKKDDRWISEHSTYDFSRRLVFIENITQRTRRSPPDGPAIIDTIKTTDTLLEDGLSILYFARAFIHTKNPISIPTLVYRKLGITHFSFPAELFETDIELFGGKKLRALRCEGKAEFEGIFGLTGDFNGWFTDDNAAVPLKAEVKVLIGSIKLELIHCNRASWQPPEWNP